MTDEHRCIDQQPAKAAALAGPAWVQATTSLKRGLKSQYSNADYAHHIEQNRIAAANCRAKKKQQVAGLEERHLKLKAHAHKFT